MGGSASLRGYAVAEGFFRPKPLLDAGHNVCEVRLRNRVVDAPTVLLHVEKPAALHEPQVLGCHVARNTAGLRQFAHRVATSEQHLNNPEAVGVGQGLQAFRRLTKTVEAREPRCAALFSVDVGHDETPNESASHDRRH